MFINLLNKKYEVLTMFTKTLIELLPKKMSENPDVKIPLYSMLPNSYCPESWIYFDHDGKHLSNRRCFYFSKEDAFADPHWGNSVYCYKVYLSVQDILENGLEPQMRGKGVVLTKRFSKNEIYSCIEKLCDGLYKESTNKNCTYRPQSPISFDV
jgi:hypothetical protein